MCVCVCVCVCVRACVAVYDSRLGCTIPGQALLKIPDRERAGMGRTAPPSSCSLALTRKVGVVVVID